MENRVMCMCEQLTRRLEHLERSNRRRSLLLALTVGALALLPLMSMTQNETAPKVIRAQSFEVVDREGHAVVHLFATDGIGAIGTSDSQGNPLLALVAERTGEKISGKITLLNSDATHLVSMGPSADGAGSVTTFSTSGTMCTTLTAQGDRGVITANSADDVPLVRIGPGPTGHGLVTTHTAQGEQRAVLGVNRSGHGTLVTSTGPGQVAVELGGCKDGGFIHVNNYAGSPVCTIDANPQGQGVVVVADRQGNQKVISVK
jgi:hypothetical protein